jgi:hypothetical protein
MQSESPTTKSQHHDLYDDYMLAREMLVDQCGVTSGSLMTLGKLQSRMIACCIGLLLAAPAAESADKPPRLKFRGKGPVCGCSSGMSEADISRAMAGLDKLQPETADTPKNSESSSNQPSRREEDGAGK